MKEEPGWVFCICQILGGDTVIWVKIGRYSVFQSPSGEGKIQFLIDIILRWRYFLSTTFLRQLSYKPRKSTSGSSVTPCEVIVFFVEGFFIASFLYKVYNRKASESVLEVRLKAFVISYNECKSANTWENCMRWWLIWTLIWPFHLY